MTGNNTKKKYSILLIQDGHPPTSVNWSWSSSFIVCLSLAAL